VFCDSLGCGPKFSQAVPARTPCILPRPAFSLHSEHLLHVLIFHVPVTIRKHKSCCEIAEAV
jgi:hypothetical protein